MKLNIKHTQMSLDEVGYSIGLALMVIGLFISGVVVGIGIAVLVLSLFLPEFVIFEIGTPEEDDNA